jgi:hypothetical protein
MAREGEGFVQEPIRALGLALAGLLLCGVAGCSVDTSSDENVTEASDALNTADAKAHLLVLVRSDNGVFTVVGSRRVESPLPKRRGDTKQTGWAFRAAGPSGAPVEQGILDNPHTLRGDFAEGADAHTTGTAITRGGPATFAVRVPVGTKLIDFFDQRLPARAAAAAAGAKAAGVSADATPPGASRLGSVSLP